MDPELKKKYAAQVDDTPLTPQEAEKRYRLELAKFVSVLFLITSLALTNMYMRQLPLIAVREYDYKSSFVFRNIYHEGELAFKACFRKKVYGGYFVCFKFPPFKGKYLQSGDYAPEDFNALFTDPVYLEKFMAPFYENEKEMKQKFLGFRIDYSSRDVIVEPFFTEPKQQTLDPDLAIQLH